MSLKETREKESAALGLELKDKQRHLFDLRSQAVTEKLEDPSQLKKARREIAQLKTILRERTIAEEKKTAAATPVTPAAVATVPKKASTLRVATTRRPRQRRQRK